MRSQGLALLIGALIVFTPPTAAADQRHHLDDAAGDLRDLAGERVEGPTWIDLQALGLSVDGDELELTFELVGDTADLVVEALPAFEARLDLDGDGDRDLGVGLGLTTGYDSASAPRWRAFWTDDDTGEWTIDEVTVTSHALATRAAIDASIDLDGVAVVAESSAYRPEDPTAVEAGRESWVDRVKRGTVSMPDDSLGGSRAPVVSSVALPEAPTPAAGASMLPAPPDGAIARSELLAYLADHPDIDDVLSFGLGFRDTDFEACEGLRARVADDGEDIAAIVDPTWQDSRCVHAFMALYISHALSGDDATRNMIDGYVGPMMASFPAEAQVFLVDELRQWLAAYVAAPGA